MQVAPGVFFLGRSVDHGVPVEGFAIADHKPQHDPRGGGNGGGETAADCFSFIARGAKWKNIEPYIVNLAHSSEYASWLDGIALTDVDGTLRAWENPEPDVSFNIFGGGATTGDELIADTSSTDGKNEIYFASIENSAGTIAFTIVWYTIGNPSWRQIVEFDMVFDDGPNGETLSDGSTLEPWNWTLSDTPDTDPATGETHFPSVATHEAGHAAGMGHTDTTDLCAQQTMFPYYSRGETHQETLDIGDVAGIKELYE